MGRSHQVKNPRHAPRTTNWMHVLADAIGRYTREPDTPMFRYDQLELATDLFDVCIAVQRLAESDTPLTLEDFHSIFRDLKHAAIRAGKL